MFYKSEITCYIRYTYYVGYGDNALYQRVMAEKPYGPDFTFEKLEWVCHVQKCKGLHLKKPTCKSVKTTLSDEKIICGCGLITNAAINKMQTYYGLAITRGETSLIKMKKASWVEYIFLSFSNRRFMNELCP